MHLSLQSIRVTFTLYYTAFISIFLSNFIRYVICMCLRERVCVLCLCVCVCVYVYARTYIATSRIPDFPVIARFHLSLKAYT